MHDACIKVGTNIVKAEDACISGTLGPNVDGILYFGPGYSGSL